MPSLIDTFDSKRYRGRYIRADLSPYGFSGIIHLLDVETSGSLLFYQFHWLLL